MKKLFKATSVSSLLMVLIFSIGCATTKIETNGKLHDQVLVYDLAYDILFLRVMQAADFVDDWNVEITDKEEGIIRYHNLNFSAFSDADERSVTFYIKRINRAQTSVQLAPESQRVIDAPKLLEAIDFSVKK